MTSQTVDLTNCDREPIHIPGLIQPHGVLLVLHPTTLEVIQVSDNITVLTGRSPQQVLNKPLSSLLDNSQVELIQCCLSDAFAGVNPLSLSLKREHELLYFDGIVHANDGVVLLELEPKPTPEKADFFDFYNQIRGAITHLQKAKTLLEMCQVVVKEVRQITGFDRVMIYRFEEDESGSVIAEDTNQEPPYLNLRYPQSDIPQQARQLYTLNWLRFIPDVNYQAVALIPEHNPLTQQPLDLSFSVLRSVSPLHVEYMQNMGVIASLSISLVQDQKLWGLIACHHASPNYVPYTTRMACEFIGQVTSIELSNKAANEDLDYKMQLKSLQTRFVKLLSQTHYFLDGIAQLGPQLLDLVSATGAVVCGGDRCLHIGNTPSESEVHILLGLIKPHLQHNLFQTRSLSQLYPAATSFKAIASGALALEISKVHGNYILWFRPEVLQTVNWAGNPNKPVEVPVDGDLRLSPRKSFARWQETVSGYSLSWKPCEIETVAELRSLIVGIVLRQADELAAMNFDLQRSNEELDSFAYIASHDLKEPLRGIHNYANFLMEDYTDTLAQDGVAKLQTIVRLTQRMEDLINSLLYFSKLGRSEVTRHPVNLNEVVQQAIATVSIARPDSTEFRIPQRLPTVECDRAQVSELFTNLISNAVKYNDKPNCWVEIGFIERGEGLHCSYYVRDNGIGIAPSHLDKIFQIFRRLHGRDDYGGGTGAGLTIARKIVERHGGKIWIESTLNQGSTFYFTLSAKPSA